MTYEECVIAYENQWSVIYVQDENSPLINGAIYDKGDGTTMYQCRLPNTIANKSIKISRIHMEYKSIVIDSYWHTAALTSTDIQNIHLALCPFCGNKDINIEQKICDLCGSTLL